MEKYGTARQATDDNIIRRMRFACWINKATDTEYVILIAFTRQRWLCESTSMLRYTYIACLVTYIAVGTGTDIPSSGTVRTYRHQARYGHTVIRHGTVIPSSGTHAQLHFALLYHKDCACRIHSNKTEVTIKMLKT
jgi:hypothetical protein